MMSTIHADLPAIGHPRLRPPYLHIRQSCGGDSELRRRHVSTGDMEVRKKLDRVVAIAGKASEFTEARLYILLSTGTIPVPAIKDLSINSRRNRSS